MNMIQTYCAWLILLLQHFCFIHYFIFAQRAEIAIFILKLYITTATATAANNNSNHPVYLREVSRRLYT